MNDILTKIKAFDDNGIDLTISSKDEIIIDIETDALLKDLFNEFNNIVNKIENLKKLILTLEKLYSEFFNSVNKIQKKLLKNEIEIISKNIKKVITEISNDVRKFKNMKANNTILRIREAKIFQLTSMFNEVLFDYGKSQADFKERYAEQLKRAYVITHPEKSESDIDVLIENQCLTYEIEPKGSRTDNKLSDIYRVKLNKTQDASLDVLYEEAIETHKDINTLESNLIELQEMFISLANLIESQDDLIDNISHNVLTTVITVDDTVDNIIIGKKVQEKGNCVLILIIIIIVLFVIYTIITILIILGAGGIGTALGIYFGLKK